MLTRLDIINEMLGSTGTAPITSENTTHPVYLAAGQKLNIVSRKLQMKGWWFNTSWITLTPNEYGEIITPQNALSVDPVDEDSTLVRRDNRLMDRVGQKFVFDAGFSVAVVTVDEVPVEDLPFSMAEYVRARAVYEFYVDRNGDGLKTQEYLRQLQDAKIEAGKEDRKHRDTNAFKSPNVQRITYRTRLAASGTSRNPTYPGGSFR